MYHHRGVGQKWKFVYSYFVGQPADMLNFYDSSYNYQGYRWSSFIKSLCLYRIVRYIAVICVRNFYTVFDILQPFGNHSFWNTTLAAGNYHPISFIYIWDMVAWSIPTNPRGWIYKLTPARTYWYIDVYIRSLEFKSSFFPRQPGWWKEEKWDPRIGSCVCVMSSSQLKFIELEFLEFELWAQIKISTSSYDVAYDIKNSWRISINDKSTSFHVKASFLSMIITKVCNQLNLDVCYCFFDRHCKRSARTVWLIVIADRLHCLSKTNKNIESTLIANFFLDHANIPSFRIEWNSFTIL